MVIAYVPWDEAEQRALVQIGSSAVIPLMEIENNATGAFRMAIMDVLAHIGDERVIRQFIKGVKDGAEWSEYAAKALNDMLVNTKSNIKEDQLYEITKLEDSDLKFSELETYGSIRRADYVHIKKIALQELSRREKYLEYVSQKD